MNRLRILQNLPRHPRPPWPLVPTAIAVSLLAGLAPHDASGQEAEATEAYLRQDWPEAARLYREVVRQDTTSGRSNYRLGFSLLRLIPPEGEAAVLVLDRAVRLSGALPVVAYEAARARALVGDHARALELLETAVSGGFSAGDPAEDPLFAGLTASPEFEALAGRARLIADPCGTIEEHGQFDFWIGEWVVRDSLGNQLGTNSIKRVDNTCALLEDWTAGAFRGISINYYDPVEARWEQHWATPRNIMELSGGLIEDGVMRMHGLNKPFNGAPIAMRATWTALPDGRVRQVFEQSTDGGNTWVQSFEGFYERSAPDDGGNELR